MFTTITIVIFLILVVGTLLLCENKFNREIPGMIASYISIAISVLVGFMTVLLGKKLDNYLYEKTNNEIFNNNLDEQGKTEFIKDYELGENISYNEIDNLVCFLQDKDKKELLNIKRNLLEQKNMLIEEQSEDLIRKLNIS